MLCLSLFLLFFFNATLSIKICSFNVRSFGEAKIARPEVLDVIVKRSYCTCPTKLTFPEPNPTNTPLLREITQGTNAILTDVSGKTPIGFNGNWVRHQVISYCDIMLLMEIKDNNNKICPLLMGKLNGQSSGPQEEYDYVISTRLGRKSYKEQYAFIYRSNVVSVKQTYQYPDTQPGDVDAFSREPFVVWFRSPKTAVKEFVIIPQHTTPETAVREIDELYDVYSDIKQRWKSENFIIMGDFNAGCGYVAKKHWKNIRLRSHSEFVWLIGDKNDTTVKSSTSCPYDRIVIRGEKLINAVVPNSADIFDFQRAFGMTEEQALEVSDHFPVVFELKTTRGFFSWLRSLVPKKRTTRNLHRLSS